MKILNYRQFRFSSEKNQKIELLDYQEWERQHYLI